MRLLAILLILMAVGCTRVVVQTPPETVPTPPAEEEEAR